MIAESYNQRYGLLCDICIADMGYGCCLYGDEKKKCDTCTKAVEDANAQVRYLNSLIVKGQRNNQ